MTIVEIMLLVGLTAAATLVIASRFGWWPVFIKIKTERDEWRERALKAEDHSQHGPVDSSSVKVGAELVEWESPLDAVAYEPGPTVEQEVIKIDVPDEDLPPA